MEEGGGPVARGEDEGGGHRTRVGTTRARPSTAESRGAQRGGAAARGRGRADRRLGQLLAKVVDRRGPACRAAARLSPLRCCDARLFPGWVVEPGKDDFGQKLTEPLLVSVGQQRRRMSSVPSRPSHRFLLAWPWPERWARAEPPPPLSRTNWKRLVPSSRTKWTRLGTGGAGQGAPPPSLPYKVDTSRPSLRTNWTRHGAGHTPSVEGVARKRTAASASRRRASATSTASGGGPAPPFAAGRCAGRRGVRARRQPEGWRVPRFADEGPGAAARVLSALPRGAAGAGQTWPSFAARSAERASCCKIMRRATWFGRRPQGGSRDRFPRPEGRAASARGGAGGAGAGAQPPV